MEFRFVRLLLVVFTLSMTMLGVVPAQAQTATPAPPFTRSLSVPIEGDDVRMVQQRLTTLGFGNFGNANGIFGPQTEAAIIAFQTANRLPVSGIVDQATWNVLFNVAPGTENQTATPPPAAPVEQGTLPAATDQSRVRLAQFGIKEESLDGPFDARYLSLRLPANWQLQTGAAIQLDFTTFFGGTGTTQQPDAPQLLGGSLDVQFNNILLGRIFLDQAGDRLVTLPISDTALISSRSDGSYSLAFILDAGLTCGTARQTSVVVRSSTVLALPHTIEKPAADLKQLPRPIIQDSPLVPDVAALIVPDQPTAGELQAALTIAAKFGSLTSNKVEIPLLTETALTPTLRSDANLIFVGRAGTIALLDSVDLPVAAKDGSFAASGAQAGDGIVQIAQSPWNPTRSVLVVSGEDDAGVIKASQALSTGTLRSTTNPALSVIAEVRPPQVLTATADLEQTQTLTTGLPIERTLSELGYETRTSFGIGAQVFDYTFEVPQGYSLSEDGYIDVLFAHSSLLNYNVSGLLVRLNDQPLSTLRFTDETANNGNVRVGIPRTSLTGGKNKLTLSANLVPNTPCIDPNAAGVWVSVRPETLIHLPLQFTQATQRINRNLSTFFDAFTTEPTLSNVAFILSKDDMISWNTAAQIAADLGNRVDGPFFELTALFADQTATVSGTHNLIVIGQPAGLPIVETLSNVLPAPFPAGSNQPVLGNSRVVYRVPADLSLGYLEIARSPWNKERTILGVFGSTNEATQWAGNALRVARLRNQLNGTVAVINGEQITIEDPTLTGDTTTLATNAIPTNTEPPTFRPLAPVKRPKWILPVIGGSIGLMWLILILVGVRAWRRSRQTRRHT